MDNPPPAVGPRVVNLGPTSAPVPPTERKFFGAKTLFLLGGFFVLLAGLGVGTFLVSRQQSQSPQSKAAASCNMRWMADPNTACGKATQKPAEGATDVSLTPDFEWGYGGYRPEDNGQCVDPSGCSAYGAMVYLSEGAAYSASTIVATCNLGTSSPTPIKKAPWSCFGLSALKTNTSYSWVVTPYGDGIVHAEQTWTYHFKTGAPAGTASCQKVFSSPTDLSKVKVNDTITFTGYGVTSAETEIIDKINFIISKDGAEIAGENTEVAATRDTTKDTEFGGKAWKATKTFVVPASGSYSVRIRIHWQNQNVWKD